MNEHDRDTLDARASSALYAGLKDGDCRLCQDFWRRNNQTTYGRDEMTERGLSTASREQMPFVDSRTVLN
jgi:hypothetical protein